MDKDIFIPLTINLKESGKKVLISTLLQLNDYLFL